MLAVLDITCRKRLHELKRKLSHPPGSDRRPADYEISGLEICD
jgi:hypothetical protein